MFVVGRHAPIGCHGNQCESTDGFLEVGNESAEIVIPLIKGQPCNWLTSALQSRLKLRHQYRLSKTGRRHHENYWLLSVNELLHQTLPEDSVLR